MLYGWDIPPARCRDNIFLRTRWHREEREEASYLPGLFLLPSNFPDHFQRTVCLCSVDLFAILTFA